MALKEEIAPRRVDKVLFWLAPAVLTITAWRSARNSTPICIVSGPQRRRHQPASRPFIGS